MIKPDAVSDGFSGPIIQQIEEAGFKIIALKKIKLSPEEAGNFYEVHKERPFFQSLCDYMSSGDIIPMVLEKENAVAEWRKAMGPTNPADADAGTIRARYGKNIGDNATHGSDSLDSSERERNIFFPNSGGCCC